MINYLVDYENVGEDIFEYIDTLEEDDHVIIFYSEANHRINLENTQRLFESNIKTTFKKVDVGIKNALDFQLSSYLGYLIAKDPSASYIIISKDTGYDSLKTFWKDIDVRRMTKIKNIFKDIDTTIKINSYDNIKSIHRKLQNHFKDPMILNQISQIISQEKNKEQIHNKLIKQFGNDLGHNYYKKIKKMVK